MNRSVLKNYLLILLLVFLPWHGVISVFLPHEFSFWKEGVIALFFLLNIDHSLWQKYGKKLKKQSWKRPEFWAFLFLIWLLILVGLNGFDYYSVVAARYLGTGFLVFGLCTLYFQTTKKIDQKILNSFVYSCALAVLFGVWAKFFGGFEILKHFYSQTISSWVPGQTIPVFHETGAFIRMQGASSGPIEFSHLLVGALFVLLLVKPLKINAWQDWSLCLILCFGIVQSFSRAAILASVLLFLVWGWKKNSFRIPQKGKWIVGFVFLLTMLIGGFWQKEFLYKNIIQRAGTSAHFTRPVEAMKLGLEKPFFGNLGQLGPAARMRNLKEINDDRALLAENIFADYFAQMGVWGLLFSLGFFVSLFFRTNLEWRIFPVIVFVTGSLASIFDMTPISIVFFLILAFCSSAK